MKDFLTNKELLEIWNSYDAYYFANKYGEETTHKEEFKKLRELLKSDEMSYKALSWISQCYDCYYKDEYNDKNNDNPFYYLQCKINELEDKEEIEMIYRDSDIHYLEKENERLNNIIKTKDEGIKALTEDLCDTTKELEEAYERIKGLEVASSKLDYESTIYANRIDKAIEYIENKNKYLESENYYQVFEYRDIYLIPLLNILKGSDK